MMRGGCRADGADEVADGQQEEGMGELLHGQTVRLTMAQALVKYLQGPI